MAASVAVLIDQALALTDNDAKWIKGRRLLSTLECTVVRNARLSGSPEYIFRNILQLVVYGHYDSLLTDERAIYDEALKIASWVNGVRVKWFF